MKVCRKCHIVKSPDAFYKLKRNSDGLHSYGKECCRNKEKTYRESNRDTVLQSNKKWYQNNKENAISRANQWKKENQEKQREIWKKSAAKRRAEGTLYKYKVSINDLLKMWGTSCNICGKPIDLEAPRSCSKPGWENGLHIDHLLPRSLGGDDTITNLRPTHGLCNIQKRNKENSNARV